MQFSNSLVEERGKIAVHEIKLTYNASAEIASNDF